MLGYADIHAPTNAFDWRALVHPDDREPLSDAMEPHLNGRAAFYESTHRMRHADGHYIWVLERGAIVERNVRGEVLRIVGTHLDMTEAKRTDSLPVLIAEIDPDGRFRFVNETYRTWLGLEPTRLIGERVGSSCPSRCRPGSAGCRRPTCRISTPPVPSPGSTR